MALFVISVINKVVIKVAAELKNATTLVIRPRRFIRVKEIMLNRLSVRAIVEIGMVLAWGQKILRKVCSS